MAHRPKTVAVLIAAREILVEFNPMTVRQLYYQLVSQQVIDNNRAQYQLVSRLMVEARKSGDVPWEYIEDRLRRPREVSMWHGLSDFAETVRRAYRRDVWPTQPRYVEVWLEKDALSGIFEDVLRPYGVTLCVGRGYDGWDSIHNAADRYQYHGSRCDSGEVSVLYFGDFDPSGEDMVRSLEERLNFFEVWPDLRKVALTYDDIQRYQLPPDPTKASDSRSVAHVAKWGDLAVELDALPPDVLRDRIKTEVEAILDLETLQVCRQVETEERQKIVDLMKSV